MKPKHFWTIGIDFILAILAWETGQWVFEHVRIIVE